MRGARLKTDEEVRKRSTAVPSASLDVETAQLGGGGLEGCLFDLRTCAIGEAWAAPEFARRC
jgi:hypothetical protein